MRQKIFLVILVSFFTSLGFAKEKISYSTDSIFNIETIWLNQNSEPIQLKKFKGAPVVLAMVYTSCQSACPLIVSDMQRIESALSPSTRDKVQFALFSFDSDKDKPNELKEFAKAHGLDLKRWSLMTAQADAVRELAAVLGIQYKKDAQGNFSHSNIITILNPEGKIIHQQVGLKQDPKESAKIISKISDKI